MSCPPARPSFNHLFGSAHDALGCPESACVVSGRAAHLAYSGEVTPSSCSIRARGHHQRPMQGSRYRLGQEGVRKCQIDGCVMLMEEDGAESRS